MDYCTDVKHATLTAPLAPWIRIVSPGLIFALGEKYHNTVSLFVFVFVILFHIAKKQNTTKLLEQIMQVDDIHIFFTNFHS